ncbi:MAG: serpin family protein [Synergistaceae bacterium]|nr:serpin family protein [Synergistaceae bacterium]
MKRSLVSILITGALFLTVFSSASDGARQGGGSLSAGAVNGLAAKLYGKLAARGENLCFSPYSVSLAFAMTYAGAAGETAAELSDVFGFGEGIHQSNEILTRNILGAPEDAGELVVANSIWPRKGFKMLDPFVRILDENYKAEIRPQDFKNNPGAAKNRINEWTESRTKGKIRDLIADGALDANTAMVLANGVYFKARWLSPFLKETTETAEFYTDTGVVSQAQIMKNTGAYEYFENGMIQAVKVPYLRGAYSMTLILPKERGGINALEEAFVSGNLNISMNDTERRRVELSVPRFKIESKFSLNKTIGELGAPAAFNPSSADFSGINGERDLFISDAIHAAFVNVDEDGTEAAGATAIAISRSSAMLDTADPVIFRADHPFLFTIRDEMSGTILFMGKLARP